MDPVEWGPAFWKTLHVVAANYPERPAACDQTRYREWFRGVGWVLPCAGCSKFVAALCGASAQQQQQQQQQYHHSTSSSSSSSSSNQAQQQAAHASSGASIISRECG